MDAVTVRDLRNHGGQVLDRVLRGEHVTISRDGTNVAELRPLPRPATPTSLLVARRAVLPPVDPDELRADIDEFLDPAL